MSTSALRENGVQITSLVSSTIPPGNAGLWWDGNTTGPKWRKADGSDITLSAGGGSTGNWTFSGNVADLSGAGAMQLGSANATSVKLIPATLNFPSAMSMAATAQGATNTTGMTLAPNVADGASSIALLLKAGTALTSGKVLRIADNTTNYLDFGNDGSGNGQIAWAGGATTAIIFSSNMFLSAGGGFILPAADNTYALGGSTRGWSTVSAFAYITRPQAVTMGATVTINPGLGSLCKMTYTSATNVTSMTISAGTDGQEIMVMLIQPAAGTAATMAASWTNVSFAGGASSFTATLAKRDVYWFTYDGTTSKWYESGRSLNLSN